MEWLDSFIKIGSGVTAGVFLTGIIAKAVRWFDRQKHQSQDIDELEKHHDKDICELRQEMQEYFATINKEQTIFTYGLLACLKGLREQGCNGPVAEAIKEIEKHLNKKAHEMEA